MQIERMFMPLLGISYRPTPKNCMNALRNSGKCVRPYLQLYLLAIVITFRPWWRHVSKENCGSSGVSYCAYFAARSRRFTFKWGTI